MKQSIFAFIIWLFVSSQAIAITYEGVYEEMFLTATLHHILPELGVMRICDDMGNCSVNIGWIRPYETPFCYGRGGLIFIIEEGTLIFFKPALLVLQEKIDGR